MLGCTGIRPALRDGNILAAKDWGHQRRFCSCLLSPIKKLAPERWRVHLDTRRDNRSLASWEIIKLSWCRMLDLVLSAAKFVSLKRRRGVWTFCIPLWRSMACHFWEQRKRSLCRTQGCASFSWECASRYAGGTCTSGTSPWDPMFTRCRKLLQDGVSIQSVVWSDCTVWRSVHWTRRRSHSVFSPCCYCVHPSQQDVIYTLFSNQSAISLLNQLW